MQLLKRMLRAMTCRGRALAAVGLLLAAPPAALAADFEIRTASIGAHEGSWELTARVDYRLPEEAITALESGVVLTFRIEVEISRFRAWFLNAGVLSIVRDWTLSFEPLSRRYLVRYPDGREPTSHATLFSALNAIGRVQQLPIAPESTLVAPETYQVGVRASLSGEALPAPLQFFAFWDGGLSIESEWYEWTFTP
ncbi:MAG: hypothetical protein AMXMBFR8_12400 [Nevskiales bacterium]